MEKEVLTILNFDLCAPSPVHFIKMYARVMKVDALTELIALYIADLQILLTNQLEFAPSLIGAACLFEAIIAQHQELPKKLFDQNMAQCIKLFGSWHSVEDFKKCEQTIRFVWQETRQNPQLNKFDAINNRYDSLGSSL